MILEMYPSNAEIFLFKLEGNIFYIQEEILLKLIYSWAKCWDYLHLFIILLP